MIHEREENIVCGPIMTQGGIQALEAMFFAIDYVNENGIIPYGLKLGAYVLDDCDQDTYGIRQALKFVKGNLLDKHIDSTCTQIISFKRCVM